MLIEFLIIIALNILDGPVVEFLFVGLAHIVGERRTFFLPFLLYLCISILVG